MINLRRVHVGAVSAVELFSAVCVYVMIYLKIIAQSFYAIVLAIQSEACNAKNYKY